MGLLNTYFKGNNIFNVLCKSKQNYCTFNKTKSKLPKIRNTFNACSKAIDCFLQPFYFPKEIN